MKKILLYFIISVSLLFVFSCSKKPYDNINLKKALDLMSKSTNLVLLDVRTPEEYMGGSAPNSINIDVLNTDFKSKIDILDKKIKEFSLNEEYFNMIKKSMISDFVYCFTGVSNVMSYLFGSYANNKKILTTDFKDFQELNFEELKEVSGIGESLYDKIKDYITL